jgi:WhiB family redox-sensing transcriptional regulator
MKRTDQTGPQTVPPQTSAAQPLAANRRVRPGARRRSRTRGRVEEVAALDWQQYGACRTGDGSVFFAPDLPGEPPSARLHRLVEAKRVCARCSVRELCRSYALENEEEFGVWGGLSEIERRHLIAERRG